MTEYPSEPHNNVQSNAQDQAKNNAQTDAQNKQQNAIIDKRQTFWFLVVGATAALVHFLLLVVCVQLVHITPIWANVIAFLFAFVVSFAGHFHLTFSSKDRSVKNDWLTSLPKWFASSVGGFLLNQGLFVLGIHWLGDSWYALIWFVVTAIVTVITFALGKLWAFK